MWQFLINLYNVILFFFFLSEFALEICTAIPWQVGLKRGSALEEEQGTILVKEEGFFFIYSQVYQFSMYGICMTHKWSLKHPNTVLSVFPSLFQALLFPGLLHRLHVRHGPHCDSYKEERRGRRESACRSVPLYSEHESSQPLQHLLHWRWAWKVLLLYYCSYVNLTKDLFCIETLLAWQCITIPHFLIFKFQSIYTCQYISNADYIILNIYLNYKYSEIM